MLSMLFRLIVVSAGDTNNVGHVSRVERSYEFLFRTCVALLCETLLGFCGCRNACICLRFDVIHNEHVRVD